MTRFFSMRSGLGASAVVVVMQAFVASSALAQQGAAVLTGKVYDASTKAPVPDVVVTVTSPALQGEQTVVTDSSGQYRIPALPSGDYTLSLDKESYKPFQRAGITLRADTTIRVDAQLLPESIAAEEIVVVARAPTVDVGSSATGMNITAEMTSRIPVSVPSGKGGAGRSYESVAELVPGAQSDPLGSSINGTSSLENSYVLDGLGTNNPGFNDNGTPLSVEFVKEVNVITGGYMPEYGRSTGGIFNVVTKSGSNEFHGSVWGNWTPGSLEGNRKAVRSEGTTIQTAKSLKALGDVGFDVGGPIIHDKLWFYTGGQLSSTVYRLDRSLNEILLGADGKPIKDDAGFTQTRPIPGTNQRFNATAQTVQLFGKLTYSVNQSNKLSLSIAALPSVRGGDGKFGMDPRYDAPELTNINGDPRALAHKYTHFPIDTVIKWTAENDSKTVLVDTTVGWHHEIREFGLAADGSALGSDTGLSGTARTRWGRNINPHSITEFEDAGDLVRVCNDPRKCPVRGYSTGGSGGGGHQVYERYQLRSVLTLLAQGAGHHVIKVGGDVELTKFSEDYTDSGGKSFDEGPDGSYFQTTFRGHLRSPDVLYTQKLQGWPVKGITAGGFVQDSWSIMDKVTLNAGVRYDAELLYSGDGSTSLVLPTEISPRLGVIYDPTQEGRAKLFANYGRFYESVPLIIPSSGTGGNPRTDARVKASARGSCVVYQQPDPCLRPENLIPIGKPSAPDQYFLPRFGVREPIDPSTKPQSSDEIVLGGEYDVFRNARVGVSYTKRWINEVIDEFSHNEGTTFEIGNPGRGNGADYPKPTRNYDAVTAYLMKSFADSWIAQFSYTVSYLRGDYAGLFKPGGATPIVRPNLSQIYFSNSVLPNSYGPLPGDHTHAFKLYGAKEVYLPDSMQLTVGGSLRARSGEPASYLGRGPRFDDSIYILPRGVDRLPWTFGADLHVGFGIRSGAKKEQSITVTVDVFNVFNFQAETSRDQTYTRDRVNPIPGGTTSNLPPDQLDRLTGLANGKKAVSEPNFGNPISYQEPRQFRFGIRSTF